MTAPRPWPEKDEETEQVAKVESLESEPQPAEVSPKKTAAEMKIVIIMKANKFMLGVQSPDCDPVYTTMEGTLAKALKRIPALVTEAKQKWDSNPRYPKADLPAPPPPSTPARTPTSSSPAKPKAQPSFF